MEAADEAEDRAPQAKERVEEANRRVKELLLERENVTWCNPQKCHLFLLSFLLLHNCSFVCFK